MTRKNPKDKCFQEILQEAQLHPTVDLALNFHKIDTPLLSKLPEYF